MLVAGVVPLMVTDDALNAQVGTKTAPVGPVTTHARLTAPVKPPLGVTVIVLDPVVAGSAIEIAAPESEMPGVAVALTVKASGVDAVTLPVATSAAFTVTVYAPVVVVEVVATLSILVAAVVPVMVTIAGVKEQVGTDVAPEGPVTVQARLTAPVKPPLGVTVIVLDPGEPAVVVMLVPLTAIAGVTPWVIATLTKVLAFAKVAPVFGGA